MGLSTATQFPQVLPRPCRPLTGGIVLPDFLCASRKEQPRILQIKTETKLGWADTLHQLGEKVKGPGGPL